MTVQVIPLPVTLVIAVPVPAGTAARLKFEAVTPVTLLLNVTVHATVDAAVGFGSFRAIETTLAAIV